jgi:hypothetical protein
MMKHSGILVGLIIFAITAAATTTAAVQNDASDQVLNIVKSIRTKVVAVHDMLTSVQSDVTAILSTVTAIEREIQSLHEPVRYEYYTPGYSRDYFYAQEDYVVYSLDWSNYGDTPAEVTFAVYNESRWEGTVNEEWNGTFVLKAGRSTNNFYVLHNLSGAYIIRIKTTTNSSFVAPSITIQDKDARIISEYHPGDLQKVEIFP